VENRFQSLPFKCNLQRYNEFHSIINDPFMRNSAILVFANKQDMKVGGGCYSGCIQSTRSLKAPGINPRTAWFQPLHPKKCDFLV
jgi:hypothetical protein